jgi:hypothetical protein
MSFYRRSLPDQGWQIRQSEPLPPGFHISLNANVTALARFNASYPSSVTLREGNLQKPYQSINTSYRIRKTWWLYLLLEKNLAISFAGAVGNRFVDKSSLRSEMENVFGE